MAYVSDDGKERAGRILRKVEKSLAILRGGKIKLIPPSLLKKWKEGIS
jgi:hypothetical protein